METKTGLEGTSLELSDSREMNDVDRSRKTSKHFLENIIDQGYRYDFFKLVATLDHLSREEAMRDSDARKRLFSGIRFRPSESDVFPATDVKRVEFSGSPLDPVTVVSSFHGLYGFHSPLPAHIRRSIELDLDEARPLRDFLDIFNNRFYRFYFRAWSKYRPYAETNPESALAFRRRFVALAGLSGVEEAPNAPTSNQRLSAFAGQLGAMARSADGLRQVIAGCMPGHEVMIEENISRKVRITDRSSIGRRHSEPNFILGETATIGQEVNDISGKFRIVLGPLTFSQFESSLPGRPGAERVQYLVSQYVSDFLAYDVELKLWSSEVPTTTLGDKTRELGRTTWLRRPEPDITSRIVSY